MNSLARCHRSLVTVLSLAAAVCFSPLSVSAGTVVVVPPSTTPCLTGLTSFSSIGAAITAVAAGAVIKVCPGTYAEQVVITKKLTLEGVENSTTTPAQDAVVITPPAGGVVQKTTDARGAVAPQILVQNTAGPVNISNLTVDGTGNQYAGDDLRGILYQDASGTVNHVAVRNEVPNDTPTGDQSGQGIFVETTNTSSASLTVENSSVHNYNKNGIVARYVGATLVANGNYVQGSGPISYIAQNGIEIAFGAGGTIENNTVIDNFYIPTTDTASDILLYDSADGVSVAVTGNVTGNSNIAIGLETDTPGTLGDGVFVSKNKIFGTSTFDGIDLCTNGNTVTSNIIFNSAQSGIHLDASCGAGTGNSVTGNTILESACAGILVDSGAGGTTTPDTFFTVPFAVTSSVASCTPPGAGVLARAQHRPRPRP